MAAITYPLSASEALQEVRINLNEASASVWTDEELNNLVIRGSADVALRTLCVIKKDTIALATNTLLYTALDSAGAGAVAKIIKVRAAYYGESDGSTGFRGLLRMDPIALKHLHNRTSGPPECYFHENASIGIYPLPTSSENTKKVQVLYSETADAITDLPDYYQEFPIYYATAMALKKVRRWSEASYWMELYLKSIEATRNDLYAQAPDSREKLRLPGSG